MTSPIVLRMRPEVIGILRELRIRVVLFLLQYLQCKGEDAGLGACFSTIFIAYLIRWEPTVAEVRTQILN